jgi:hypothetical protein
MYSFGEWMSTQCSMTCKYKLAILGDGHVNPLIVVYGSSNISRWSVDSMV